MSIKSNLNPVFLVLLYIAALGMIGVSVLLTIELFMSWGDSPKSEAYFGFIGFGAEVLKIICIPVAYLLWRKSKILPRIAAGFVLSFSLSLIVVSMGASVAALGKSTSGGDIAAVKKSQAYKDIQQEIKTKNISREMFLTQAKQFQSSKNVWIRNKAKEPLKKVAALNGDISALKKKARNLNGALLNPDNATFKTFADFTGFSIEEIRTFGFLILAFILESGGMLSTAILGISAVNNHVTKSKKKKGKKNVVIGHDNNVIASENNVIPVNNCLKSVNVPELMAKINNGTNPTVRNVARVIGCGNNKAKHVLLALSKQNYIDKKGSFYYRKKPMATVTNIKEIKK